MNVLEQLRAMGLREQPYQFYDGGDTNGDPSGEAGPGPGGPSNAEITAADAIASLGLTQSSGATLNDAIANALAEVVTSNISKDWSSSEGRSARSALQSLESMGRGRMEGLNPNNPTQSVQNLLASSNVAAAAPYAMSFMPGMGLAKGIQTGAQLVADLSSGKLSPQDAFTDLALSIASAVTNQSKDTLAAAVRGDFGTAAMSAAKDAIIGTVAQNIGAPASIVGAAFNAGLNALGSGTTLGGGASNAPGGGTTNIAGGGGGDTTGGTNVANLGGDASSDFLNLESLGPLVAASALENILTSREKEEQEQARARTLSPFGFMPYT